MINYNEALKAIASKTKQGCNLFTLLHFVYNGDLDIFISGENYLAKYTVDALDRHKGYIEGVEHNLEEYLKIELRDGTNGETDELAKNLFNVLLTNKTPLLVNSVSKKDTSIEDNYFLLHTGFDFEAHKGTVNSYIEETGNIYGKALAIEFAVEFIGKEFTRNDFLFDENQIRKLKPVVANPRPQDEILKKKTDLLKGEVELGRDLLRNIRLIGTKTTNDLQIDIVNAVFRTLKIAERSNDTIKEWQTNL